MGVLGSWIVDNWSWFGDNVRSFGDVVERFGDIGERFGDIGEGLGDVGERFGDVGERFVGIGKSAGIGRFTGIGKRPGVVAVQLLLFGWRRGRVKSQEDNLRIFLAVLVDNFLSCLAAATFFSASVMASSMA